VCAFCGTSVFVDRHLVSAADYRRSYERALRTEHETLSIAGRAHRVLGRIATGHSCDVFLAERVAALGQRVVVKVLRAETDADLVARESVVLQALAASAARGASHFRRLVPEWVAGGDAEPGAGGPRPAIVTRWASGFVHTLEDVREQHGASLDPRHAVWIWRRLLEILAFIHRSGFRHGALLPQHVLVHARDHGVRLVGFSLATELGAPARPVADPRYPFQEPGEADVAASARLVSWLLGAEDGLAPPDRVPDPFAAVLRREATHDGVPADPLALANEVRDVADAIYGPPKFVPLAMAGW
jgi:serine/threonine protein kinase